MKSENIEKVENASIAAHTGRMSRAMAEKKMDMLRETIRDAKSEIARLEDMVSKAEFGKMDLGDIAKQWDASSEDERGKMVENRPLFWKMLANISPIPEDPTCELNSVLDQSWKEIMECGEIDMEEVFEDVCS